MFGALPLYQDLFLDVISLNHQYRTLLHFGNLVSATSHLQSNMIFAIEILLPFCHQAFSMNHKILELETI